MSYYLFWPDAEDLKNSGFGSVAQVPCVFRTDWSYEEAASRYLRERAKLEWVSSSTEMRSMSRARYPTRQTLEVYGQAACNFLEWCELRGLDWRTVEYTRHLVDGYQAEMVSGLWSASGRPLKASTVNLRVREACNFLSWAAWRDLRRQFKIVASTRKVAAHSARSSHGHHALEVQSRAGSVRPDPIRLRIPTDAEIKAWHNSILIQKGFTKALMCEVVLKTALRREEVVQWRVDTLPESERDWHRTGDFVNVTIAYGAKGPKTVDENGEECGPPRVIAVPLNLARRLAHYREFIRPGLRATYARAAYGVEERRRRMRAVCRQLFLSDFTGEAVSAQSLYEAWTQVYSMPFKGWSPHLGRHYWACKTLIDTIEQRAKTLVRPSGYAFPSDWILGSATDTIDMVIQPQLGHVSAKTSQAYLVWVQRAFTMTAMHDEYEQELETLVTTERLDA